MGKKDIKTITEDFRRVKGSQSNKTSLTYSNEKQLTSTHKNRESEFHLPNQDLQSFGQYSKVA